MLASERDQFEKTEYCMIPTIGHSFLSFLRKVVLFRIPHRLALILGCGEAAFIMVFGPLSAEELAGTVF